jgi:hypothetical protein
VVLYSEPDATGPVFDGTTFEVSDSNTDTSCLDDEDISNNPDGSDQLLTLDTDLVVDSSYSSEYGVESRAWLANSYQFPALSDLTLNILTLGGEFGTEFHERLLHIRIAEMSTAQWLMIVCNAFRLDNKRLSKLGRKWVS